MNGWMGRWVDACMNGWEDEQIGGWVGTWIWKDGGGWKDECMDEMDA